MQILFATDGSEFSGEPGDFIQSSSHGGGGRDHSIRLSGDQRDDGKRLREPPFALPLLLLQWKELVADELSLLTAQR